MPTKFATTVPTHKTPHTIGPLPIDIITRALDIETTAPVVDTKTSINTGKNNGVAKSKLFNTHLEKQVHRCNTSDSKVFQECYQRLYELVNIAIEDRAQLDISRKVMSVTVIFQLY